MNDKKQNEIKDLEFLFVNAIINNSTTKEAAEYLYKAGYRKQSETVKEFAEKLKQDIEKAIDSNYKVMSNRTKADDVWLTCSSKISACSGILQALNDLAEQYGKEE